MLPNEKLRKTAVLCTVSELVKEIFVGAEVFKSSTFGLEMHAAASLNLVSYRGLKTGSCVCIWSRHCVGWMHHVSRDSGCFWHYLHKPTELESLNDIMKKKNKVTPLKTDIVPASDFILTIYKVLPLLKKKKYTFTS